LRREQNRTLALEALLSLYAEGRFEPSAADVAERAGLSPRSLFRYFDDTDDLARAAVEHHLALAEPLARPEVDADAPLAERIDAVVSSRLSLWEAVAPGARVARLRAHRSPVVADALRRNRATLRRQLRRLFAAELDALAEDERRAALAAADVACSFEAVELLRHDQRLDLDDAAAAMTTALLALFDHAPRPPALETTGGTAG
jgi:AcrR family transcriptional regulator